ncbi:MAG: cell division protein FtsB [Gammaproteobacteria bacterium]
MKLLVGTLLILLVGLQYKLWFGESGFQQMRAYQARIATLKQALEEVRSRNAILQAEVDDLKNGMDGIEERARRDLGMIRKNETFFQIIEAAKQ